MATVNWMDEILEQESLVRKLLVEFTYPGSLPVRHCVSSCVRDCGG